MPLCLDASVAVKWFVPEQGQAEALGLWERYAAGEQIVEPDLFFVEVANGLRHHGQAGNLTENELAQAVELLQSLQVESRPAQELVAEALRLAGELALTVWDAMYVAVVREQQAELWTADETLYGRSRGVVEESHLLTWAS
jgi:predicted nucleic acid-binding protein